MKKLFQKYSILLVVTLGAIFLPNSVFAENICRVIDYDDDTQSDICFTDADYATYALTASCDTSFQQGNSIYKKGKYVESKLGDGIQWVIVSAPTSGKVYCGSCQVPKYFQICSAYLKYCVAGQEDHINISGDSNISVIKGSEGIFNWGISSESSKPIKGFFCGSSNKDIVCKNDPGKVTMEVPSSVDIGEYDVRISGYNEDCISWKDVKLQVTDLDCGVFDSNKDECDKNKYCFFNTIVNKCVGVNNGSICKTIPKDLCGTEKGSQACVWSETKSECITKLSSSIENRYKKPDDYAGPLPDCAFDGSCKDINKLLELAINVGEMLFGVIGSLAFVFFIYGGFTMILSFGSAEKFKKGQQILIAAVIGMVIAFGAYALVGFLMTSLGVSSSLIFIQ